MPSPTPHGAEGCATPGPWEAHDVAGRRTDRVDELATIYAAGQLQLLAEVEAPTLDQRLAGANLRLMAAAPELAWHLRTLASAIDALLPATEVLHHQAQRALQLLAALPQSALRLNEVPETAGRVFPWTSAALTARLWEGAGGRLVTMLGYGWNDGGCLQLARALVHILGSDASLVMVRCPQHRWCHVVTQCGGWYLDGDGIATGAQMIQRWQVIEGHVAAWLAPFDATLVNQETPDNPSVAATIVDLLRWT
ncbi:MAG: hypothetical protein H0X24_10820 [Ktedonobacterales bacterium]|nr:hypothetical protein [Ktedonobacterales bacterium]